MHIQTHLISIKTHLRASEKLKFSRGEALRPTTERPRLTRQGEDASNATEGQGRRGEEISKAPKLQSLAPLMHRIGYLTYAAVYRHNRLVAYVIFARDNFFSILQLESKTARPSPG